MRESRSIDWWRADRQAVTAAQPGRLAFAALVAYIVILVAAPQEFLEPLKPLRIALVAAVIAIGCHLADRWRGAVPITRTPKEVAFTMMLVGLAVATVPLSYWPGGTVTMLLDLYLKSVAVFLLLASVVDTTRRLRVVAGVLCACTVPIALTAVQHYRTGTFMANAPGRIAGYGGSGLAGNPNDLALLLALVLPITAALVGLARRPATRFAALMAVFLNVSGIVATFSRSGFIAVIVIAMLYLWRSVRRGRLVLGMAVLVGALALPFVAPQGYIDRLSTMSDIETDTTNSAQNRWRDTVVATRFVFDHPFVGAGAGMDYLALNDVRGAAWLSVHNAYLNYAVDLGLPGLTLFLCVFFTALAGVARVERHRVRLSTADELGRMASAVRIALVAFAVAAFFYPIAYHAYFYLLAGLSVAIQRIDARERLARA